MLDIYRPYGTLLYRGCFVFYQYLAPNGAVPQGQDVGRKQIKTPQKSRRDNMLF
jgi:hypothetical protein